MASVTDKLRRGAPAFSTTLAADKGAGAASATLSSATGVPTDTAIDFTIGRVDSNGLKTPALKAVYKATLSGSTISNLTLVEGTDQLHKAGTPVEITLTAATWNDMVTWGLTQHNQNGTHAVITATSLATTGSVTVGSGLTVSAGTVAIPNNSILANALDTGAITLGYAQTTTTFNTSSTTAVQVTGLTISVTIPTGGRRVRITAYTPALFNTASGSHTEMSIWDGTVGTGTQLSYTTGYNTTSNSWSGGTAIAIVTPPAGSKTYNIGALVFTTGTAQITASSNGPSFILVEAI